MYHVLKLRWDWIHNARVFKENAFWRNQAWKSTLLSQVKIFCCKSMNQTIPSISRSSKQRVARLQLDRHSDCSVNRTDHFCHTPNSNNLKKVFRCISIKFSKYIDFLLKSQWTLNKSYKWDISCCSTITSRGNSLKFVGHHLLNAFRLKYLKKTSDGRCIWKLPRLSKHKPWFFWEKNKEKAIPATPLLSPRRNCWITTR